jgi:UDP-N-acetyl-D-mannosaminuronate dehydrogenase
MKKTIVVAGLGEVGKPLFDLLSRHHEVVGVDVNPAASTVTNVDVLHVCYPYQIKDFVGETARYIEQYAPKLTIINSTVAVGTTRSVAERTRTPLAYSPVRGKHAKMLDDMQKYTKFVGGMDSDAGQAAAAHFQSAGLKTRILSSPEAAEIAKLTETTFFGLMIAWAQEVERYADQVGQSYDEIVSFYDEIGFFPPVKYFPGVIGGHCVMPNIELLKRFTSSEILSAIESSNEKKAKREKEKPAHRS